MKTSKVLILALLVSAAGIILALKALSVTSTVTISVTSYISASGVDTASQITLNPANAPVLTYNNWKVWAGAAPSDDIIINLTGTNVNVTVYATNVTYALPPSWPQGLLEPLLWFNYTLDSSSLTEQLSSVALMLGVSGNITLSNATDYLYQQYLSTLTPLTWIDLPEGLFNTLYGTSYTETDWYNFTYAKQVTLPILVLKYDPATNSFVPQISDTQVCVVLVDPDRSIYSGNGIDGDELVVIGTSCKLDSDGSNTTAAGTIDLASGADYAYTGTIQTSGQQQYYEEDQLGFRLLNMTVNFIDSTSAIIYLKPVLSYDPNTQVITITLRPSFPLEYASTLGAIYANDQQPYVHMWPSVLIPVGAPAGQYKVTLDVAVEQP